MHKVKQLKPSKSSRYRQGYIDPNTCKKLINNTEPVIYRSSYERRFVAWMENCEQVVRWGSECIAIIYIMPDGSRHTYYPDYFVELNDGKKYVIEIKPSNQTRPPINENAWARHEWVKNSCKWKFAIEYCQANGFEFKILTEKTINYLC